MRKRLFQSVLAISLSAALVLSPIAGTASFAQTENLGESSVAEVREDYISTPGDVTPGAVDQVEINKTNFPDANFRQYVKDAIDTDGNGVLSSSEIGACTIIDCYWREISSLKGIEIFYNLETLNCYHNALTSLDVSQNTALWFLNCSNNALTGLDVSQNTGLTWLSCGDNALTSLDVSKNTGLTDLYCYYNALTDLDVSKNTALGSLDCSGNELTSLDVRKNTALEYLDCYNNALTSLDVSQNTALESLDCSENALTSLITNSTALTYLNCGENELTSLDVSQNTALWSLNCYDNALTSLDVSKNTALGSLDCSGNELTSLDVRKNTALEYLDCSYNAITSLDVSQNTGLTTLWCNSNALTGLDVSQNTGLTELRCYNNALTSLDVSKNTGLTTLCCNSNALTGLDVSQNTALEYLDCDGNELTSLITNSAALEYLDCYNNALTSLDVSKNTGLTTLWCNSNALTGLDVSQNTALEYLNCSWNRLTSLITNSAALEYLDCSGNALTSLDVSKNTGLTDLYCEWNQLTSLDVSKNTGLTDLDCYDNAITSLDVSQNTALEYLDCYNNALTSLDVSQNIALAGLRCYGNHINSVDISKNTKLYHFVLLNTPAVKIPVKVASGIQVSWEKSFGADGYYVYRRMKGGSWTRIAEVEGEDTLYYIDKTATASNTYDYTIRGHYKHNEYDEAGNSTIEVTELSGYDKNGKSITIGSSALATPKITAVSNEATGVKISWGKVTGAAKYRVYYKTGSGSWVRITDTTSTSYTWTGAKSGMKYTFTVRCLSSDGKSFTSNYDKTGKTLTYVATPKLSGVSNEATGVKISWGKVTGAAKYRVYYKTGSGSWVRITDTTSTSYTWTGAKSGTKYTFTVRCLSSDGKSFTSGYDKTGKTLTYVATPKLSGVSNVNGGVKISWGKVTGAAKYRVYYKTGSGSWVRITDTTSTSYTWTGAKSGMKYTFTVRCISSDGKKTTSDYDKTGKGITIPASTTSIGKPTVNTPTKVSNGVKVSWSKVSGANSYYVYRRTKGGSWSRLAVVNGGSTVSYTDTTVKAGTTYEYTVRAYNGNTLGDYDKTGKSITIPASTTSIGKPAVNTPTKVSNGVKVSWSKVSGANSYYVYRRTKGGSWSRLAIVNGGSTVSYTDTTVKAGTTYEYTVRAYNGKTLGDYDKTGKSITIPASTTSIGKPTVNTPTKVSNGVKVTWSKVSGASSYYVYRRTKGGSWSRLAIVNGGSTVSYTDTSVKAGTTYDYTVRAYNGKALGDYDKTGKSITIPASTTAALGKPTVNTPTKVSNGVKVSWSKVSGANSYYVYRRTKGGSWSRLTVVNGGSTVSYTDTSVKAGITYEYTVRAYDGKTLGDYDKNGKSITIPASITSIGKPTVNTPTKVSNGVKVSWSKVSGASSYYVYRRTKGGSWSRLAIVNGGSTVSYTDTSVKAGTTYDYTVRAYNGKALGDYDKTGKSITIPASTTAALGKPTVNTPTKVSNGVKVSWSKVSGANSYYVYRRTKGGSWSRLVVVNGGSTVSYTDTTVKAGTTYEYTVRAYDGKTLGDYDKNGKSITVTK